ncbi:hypothetical protein OUZ56_016438 [Daphnia magna]|uniref:Uncharacterized protein n=1 Tax=Daphnia magna TaxID=35525 RepID=A0ABR0AQJ9_9CRUS|nr:hypothetical protein OUZ56_016438 [Daphnia magna]
MHHHHFIKWPVANEIPAVSEEFKKLAGFPGATGAMDGTCRNIQAPEETVCLPNRSFSYSFTGFPQSAHDSRVFGGSDLGAITYVSPTVLPSQAGL